MSNIITGQDRVNKIKDWISTNRRLVGDMLIMAYWSSILYLVGYHSLFVLLVLTYVSIFYSQQGYGIGIIQKCYE